MIFSLRTFTLNKQSRNGGVGMYFYKMTSQDIRTNLATEEYLMNHKEYDEPILLLYIQQPSIIIGRNQNPREEIDLSLMRKLGVTLTRRKSGGGTVYDDLGNISFSVVMDKKDTSFGDYDELTLPIVEALKSFGLKDIAIDGRNDITLYGKKISGNAMYTKKNRLFSHGTLLYDVDLDVLPKLLTVSRDKIESKGTRSVRSRVTNIKPFLTEYYQSLTAFEFRDELIKAVYHVSSLEDISHKELSLTKQDEDSIKEIVDTYYGNEQWIYGEAPKYCIQKRKRFPKVGIIDIRMNVEKGYVTDSQIFGDFFGQRSIKELEDLLQGVFLTESCLKERFNAVKMSDYFTGLTVTEWIELLVE